MAESTQAGQVPNGSTADSEAMRQQIEEQQRLINELLEGRSGSLAGTVVRAPNAPPNEQGSQQPSTPYADYSGVDGMTNPLVSDLDRDGEWEADAAYARHLQELEMMTSVEIEDPESNRPKLVRVLTYGGHCPLFTVSLHAAAAAAVDVLFGFYLFQVDPVWGSFEAPARGHRPHQVLCIALCPCCVRPCCSPERKQSWKRVLRSMSFILGTLQVLLVIGSLFVRGFAPTELNPMLGPWPDTLDAMGAKNAAKIILRGQVHRFFLPMLLHAGFVHLAMNVLMQLRLGVMLVRQSLLVLQTSLRPLRMNRCTGWGIRSFNGDGRCMRQSMSLRACTALS